MRPDDVFPDLPSVSVRPFGSDRVRVIVLRVPTVLDLTLDEARLLWQQLQEVAS